MLRKILTIKNIGRFEDRRWRGGSQFESMALIYAENARGKSTFCDILRSCQNNSPATILGRRRLGTKGAGEVELRTDGSNLKFDGAKRLFATWAKPSRKYSCFHTTRICKDDSAGFVQREVLYPVHRHVADRFYKPRASRA